MLGEIAHRQQSFPAFVRPVVQFGHATCNGRLTLATGDPINTAGSTGGTLYFTPYNGNYIGLYDGSATWNLLPFSEVSIAVPGTTGVYDVFAYNNSGTLTLETLAWTNTTTRATSLVFQDGVYVKSGATTRRYIGTIYSVSGTATDNATLRGVWNYSNRVQKVLFNSDSTSSYTYTTNGVWRLMDASASWTIKVVVGQNDSLIDVKVTAVITSTNVNVYYYLGVGYDRTNGNDSNYGNARIAGVVISLCPSPGLINRPDIGLHSYNGVEYNDGGQSGVTVYPLGAPNGITALWTC